MSKMLIRKLSIILFYFFVLQLVSVAPYRPVSSPFGPERRCKENQRNWVLNGTSQDDIPALKLQYPFRYHSPSKSCYLVGATKPCGKLMQFYRIGKTENGDCDCHAMRCGIPLVYWERERRCYFINTQGPCANGYWITFGSVLRNPVCRRNPCLHEEKANPSNFPRRQFWTFTKGKCVRTHTIGYCSSPLEVYHFKEGEGIPRCVLPSQIHSCNPAERSIMSRPCWVGQKFYINESCFHSVGLWGTEDDH